MALKQWGFIPFIFILATLCLSNSEPRVVYRADMITPHELKHQGGFIAHGLDATRPFQPAPDMSLFNHVEGSLTGLGRLDSGYVATTSDIDFARRFVQERLCGSGYIYRIHVAPNLIDVSGTLGHFYRHREEAEYAALGRIPFIQVLGWTEVVAGAELPEVQNRHYDSWFDHAVSGGIQPQLAGFPSNHPAWRHKPWLLHSNCLDNMKRQQPARKVPGNNRFCSPYQPPPRNAAEYLASSPVTRLMVKAELSASLLPNLGDLVLVQFGNYPHAVRVFHSVQPKKSLRIEINMTTAFGRSEIPLRTLSSMTIFQTKYAGSAASDDVKIKGAWIRRPRSCFSSGRVPQ